MINLLISINNGVEIAENVINYDNQQIIKTKRNIIKACLINEKLEDGTPYLYRGVK